ncbi:sulfurtransferase [Gordoniibacillus kamchatkensis]|uniref:Sulfurtransferase n=1 Tax=Gordoniibacillus kamchatkensis TaxID=1590651 RepID=A0ABR5AJH2_9BACL|nr:rhodanese-like domain-containing protein [Paenibacillus sp. VKM B-2647]KIL41176.1 sulfurtransferase [Paenibacillus sp. VKM B-2647]
MNDLETISPEEVKRRLGAGEKLNIIDVREPEEVLQGRIPGAVNIPLGELPERHGEIARSGEIILVCRSGNRSQRAYQYLSSLNIPGLRNMTGGMLAWDQL